MIHIFEERKRREGSHLISMISGRENVNQSPGKWGRKCESIILLTLNPGGKCGIAVQFAQCLEDR